MKECVGVGTETRNIDRGQKFGDGNELNKRQSQKIETETGTEQSGTKLRCKGSKSEADQRQGTGTGKNLRGEGSKIQYGAETKALFSNKNG